MSMDKWKDAAEALYDSLLLSELEEYDETVVVLHGYRREKLRDALALYDEARRYQAVADYCVAIDAGHI